MKNINKLPAILVIFITFVCVERAQGVRCFARIERSSGRCEEALDDIDEEICCLNPHYAYLGKNGACQSCGPAAWSDWSPWSPCNTLCGEGVTQRRRKCLDNGESECRITQLTLETKPCNGTCCTEGWSPWLPWSPCSLTCGGVGVRKRARVCAAPPECISACVGDAVMEMMCNPTGKCPVHGGWTSWSSWSSCSHTCVLEDAPLPTKQRHRSCSNPVPSNDTTPPGDACHGDETQRQSCNDIPKCPVDGNWGEWSPPGLCSAQCGEGLRLSIRQCDQPAPKYGGRHCVGSNALASICHITCASDGNWSGWSHWTECSASCIPESGAPVRTRKRSCSSPSPSLFPTGKNCPGNSTSTEACVNLPHCAVDGAWGPWSAFSACPVTCGVGVEVTSRSCDSPAPKYGGRPCDGDHQRTRLCNTIVHCPVDGVWSEWSPWGSCTYPFKRIGQIREIRCKQIGGGQTRERKCLHQEHGGAICGGDDISLSQYRGCYDVNNCYVRGTWEGWDSWSLCRPVCGQKPRRIRRRKCSPDYSNYRPTISRQVEPAAFFGTPLLDCGDASPGFATQEVQPCVNVPACAPQKHDDDNDDDDDVCKCSQ
ncbi:properdin-like isoform X1 [Festucalex cinctus]